MPGGGGREAGGLFTNIVDTCMTTIFGNDLQRERIRNDTDLSSIICGLLRTIYVRVDSTPKTKM